MKEHKQLEKIEDEIRTYLDQEELRTIKKLHRNLSKSVVLDIELDEKSGGHAIVSYGLKGRMMPKDQNALESFGKQVQSQVESAEVVEFRIKFEEELRVRYKA